MTDRVRLTVKRATFFGAVSEAGVETDRPSSARIEIDRVIADEATLPGGTELSGNVGLHGIVIETETEPEPEPAPTHPDGGSENGPAPGTGSLNADGSVRGNSSDQIPESVSDIPTDCPACDAGYLYGDATGYEFDGGAAKYECPRCGFWKRGPDP